MEKCVLFGAGKIASKIHEKYKEEIVAVIDNDPSRLDFIFGMIFRL